MGDATTPTLVLLAGWPGAGKSTVARALAWLAADGAAPTTAARAGDER
ncbi:MAG TPA: zeta toxin family protein [Ktedonobacterales bacterium]|nr:zeta toxin family protein [Ktedonobacterales bacterium]